MLNHANVLGYFFQAGFVVKSVMIILFLASLLSWTLILQRAWYFRQVKSKYKQFTKQFWESRDLSQLYTSVEHKNEDLQGLAAVFYHGFKTFLRLRKLGSDSIEAVQRSMHIWNAKEAEKLAKHLPILASIGSIAPYIGLFGTVWGIMTSFQALGQAQQATIAMVAPGISEALVATALGLFTAIPAVIAYNRYSATTNEMLDRYDLFQEEFIALIAEQTRLSTGAS